MASGLQLFTTLLLVSLFYSVAVTFIVPTLPNMGDNQVQMFVDNGQTNIMTLSQTMQAGVTSTQNVPLLAAGALIFYSANIIVNLMLNFFTAIPQMITILFYAVATIIPGMSSQITAFAFYFQAIVTIIYILSILVFFMGAVTGRGSSGI